MPTSPSSCATTTRSRGTRSRSSAVSHFDFAEGIPMPNLRRSGALTLLLLAAPLPLATFATFTSAQSAGANAAGRTPIATIPDSYTAAASGWMPSCNVTLTVCAYVAQDGGKSVVVLNGKAGPAFDEVK